MAIAKGPIIGIGAILLVVLVLVIRALIQGMQEQRRYQGLPVGEWTRFDGDLEVLIRQDGSKVFRPTRLEEEV